MDEQVKERLTRSAIWVRALYMVFFAIAYGIAELLLWVLVVAQFLIVLFTGSANGRLLQFGNNLSAYIYALLRFLTFNTEIRSFPFADWPNEAVGENSWTGDPEPAAAPADIQGRDEKPEDADEGEQQDR